MLMEYNFSEEPEPTYEIVKVCDVIFRDVEQVTASCIQNYGLIGVLLGLIMGVSLYLHYHEEIQKLADLFIKKIR